MVELINSISQLFQYISYYLVVFSFNYYFQLIASYFIIINYD